MPLSAKAQAWLDHCEGRIGFDGIYRPEPWLSDHDWRAFAYINDGKFGRRFMDDHGFREFHQAQARCDELNATREAVSRRKDMAKRPQTLF